MARLQDNRHKRRGGTSTSDFGVGRREGHDSSDFYARFAAPEISSDSDVPEDSARVVDDLYNTSSTRMDEVADGSVALVVTSPPYFVGKEYEADLDADHVPSSYLEYLDLLREVFAECVRKLEPGGRIAVNVANLGRRPYRSLSADVISIFQDDLRLLLRGEIIWRKQRGASGSCAWGSFASPSNPVLRDLTERVIVASKGRFDRAVGTAERRRRRLPSNPTISVDEFMEATLDVWEIPSESARRVGHPAPFPVALPERLIELYTYSGDLVLDPFLGSGSTAVAAVRHGRHYVGYDTDATYIELARSRIEREVELLQPELPWAEPGGTAAESDVLAAPRAAKKTLEAMLQQAGVSDVLAPVRVFGIEYPFGFTDAAGGTTVIDHFGSFSASGSGLRRSENLWRALGRAVAVREQSLESGRTVRVVLSTTDLPDGRSAEGKALARSLAGSTRDGHCPLIGGVVTLDQAGIEVIESLVGESNGIDPK